MVWGAHDPWSEHLRILPTPLLMDVVAQATNQQAMKLPLRISNASDAGPPVKVQPMRMCLSSSQIGAKPHLLEIPKNGDPPFRELRPSR